MSQANSEGNEVTWKMKHPSDLVWEVCDYSATSFGHRVTVMTSYDMETLMAKDLIYQFFICW